MIKTLLLWLARIPAEPEPPAGSAESIRVFRASPNLFYWNLVGWGASQLVVLFLLGLVLFAGYRIEPKLPNWGRFALSAGQGIAVTLFLLQFAISGYKQRLDYEMRWYVVTDRSLRIRSGIFFVREVTMTFANIQRVSLNQGPLQRLLGIADVQVSTAGGGGQVHAEGKGVAAANRHTALFEGVSNAREIRDLILERLRLYRDAGLGDPDDHDGLHHPVHQGDAGEYHAAVDVLAEVRALSAALSK